MKISVDTKEDSHDDIKKVIKMLQHLVGDSQEIFTNEPSIAQEASPMANIFGDSSPASETPASSETAQETQQEATQEAAEETSQSTEDLFAELFSEEELKKMDTANVKGEEEDE
ncbi:hypothetical protein HYX05_02595, partial [Candidatus Woesearchaeota archaeon]|nr:hypothetical protein [Candidatus Woesearchaeota archaeon]